jgi:transcriptional regulator with XRE-family HTH domain
METDSIKITDTSELAALIRKARLAKGMSREELAVKSGTTKAIALKAEKPFATVRVADLRKIIETGLGGQFGLRVVFDD